jgi:AcrR family transcriptional regulator
MISLVNSFSPRNLTLDRIVDAAFDLYEADGLEALTMRRVASHIGVTAMALYPYVKTKDGLLDLVAARCLDEVQIPDQSNGWKETVMGVFRSFHEIALARPVLVRVLTAKPVDAAAAYRMSEAILGVLDRAGFEKHEALELYVVVSCYVVGFTLAQAARIDPGASVSRADRLKHLKDFPHLGEVADEYSGWAQSDMFDDGLQRVLAAYLR